MEKMNKVETDGEPYWLPELMVRQVLEYCFNDDPRIVREDGRSGIESALDTGVSAAFRYTVSFPTRALARVIRSV